jgi:cell division protein FtsA
MTKTQKRFFARRCVALNSSDMIVSLDIGTSQVRVIMGECTPQGVNIVGVGSAPSDGVHKGKIVHIDQTVGAIRAAINHAEQMVGFQIQEVYCGISDPTIQLQTNRGIVAVSREDREITHEDIDRAMQAARIIPLPPERDIIDTVPRQYIVDGLEGIHDPRGMIGVRLEVEATVVTGSKTTIHNLMRSVERADVKLAGLVLTPLAAGKLALLKDEQNLGVVLVDIGAGATTVSLFSQGDLCATTTLEIGGEYVTNDITIAMKTQVELAEKLKRKYGHAIESLASPDVTFQVYRIGTNSEKTYNQQDLASVIEPRMQEILEYVHHEVLRMLPADSAVGYVLTGGVVAMPGMQQLAQEVFQKPVRIAVPDFVGVREPGYTSGVGLLHYVYAQRNTPGNAQHKSVRVRKTASIGTNVWKKMKTWVNEFI